MDAMGELNSREVEGEGFGALFITSTVVLRVTQRNVSGFFGRLCDADKRAVVTNLELSRRSPLVLFPSPRLAHLVSSPVSTTEKDYT